MRTALLLTYPEGVSAQPGGSAYEWGGGRPPPWTEGMTHAYEKITFP